MGPMRRARRAGPPARTIRNAGPGPTPGRATPAVALAERLLGKGYRLSIYDEDIHPERLLGANRAFIDQHLPHLGELLSESLDATLAASDVIVVTKLWPDVEGLAARLRDDQVLVDLVGLDAVDAPAHERRGPAREQHADDGGRGEAQREHPDAAEPVGVGPGCPSAAFDEIEVDLVAVEGPDDVDRRFGRDARGQ